MELNEERRRKLAWLRKHQPERYKEILDVLFEVERRAKRAEYERSFLAFVRRFWSEVDPAELRLAWFHETLIEHLEAVCHGEIRSLLCNLPPRVGKSLIVSVLYPSWIWARASVAPQSGPQISFLAISYSAALAETFAVKMRRLVFGHAYQALWGERVKMLPDQLSRADFGNSAGGMRLSNSLEAGLLGKGADCHLVDDPHSVSGAESDAERLTTLRAFSESLPTQVSNPQTAARIMVCQRTHEDDASNLVLETWPDVVHLMFPARYEINRHCPQDKRTYEGELLFPEIWDEASLRRVELGLEGLSKGEAGLSSYAASAQLAQAPVPRGGGVIRREDWKVWPETPPQAADVKRDRDGRFLVELPPVSFVLVSCDTAYSEKDSADFSAVVVLGVWSRRREEVTRASPWYSTRWGAPDLEEEARRLEDAEEQARVILMEGFVTRAPLNDLTPGRDGKPRGLCQRLIDVCRRRRADRLVLENANRAQDTMREIQRQIGHNQIMIELFEPSEHGSKLNRMMSCQSLFANGLVYSPANLVRTPDGGVELTEFKWVEEIVAQCQRCPRGKQDLCDATSMGLIWLRKFGFLQLQPEFIQSELDRRAWKPKPFNVARSYGVA
jgi:hypothetical protein